MNSKFASEFYIRAISCLILFIFQFSIASAQSSTQEYLGWQKYISTVHNISFYYPKNFKIKEFGPSSLNLSGSKGFGCEIDISNIEEIYKMITQFSSGQTISSDKMKEVAFNRAMAYNSADGPDGSYYGSDPIIDKEFKTSQGLRAIKFYMTGVTEDYIAETTSKVKIGPFYGVDISSKSRRTVIVIMFQTGELANSGEEKLMDKIVESISIVK